MKSETHPDYEQVVFHDTSQDTYFLIGSTIKTKKPLNIKAVLIHVPLIFQVLHTLSIQVSNVWWIQQDVLIASVKNTPKKAPKSTVDENVTLRSKTATWPIPHYATKLSLSRVRQAA